MSAPQELFALGDWQVEPTLNQLARDGRVVTVEPLTMDLLLVLAKEPGRVVSTDQIVDEVWAGHNVSDNPVYKHIAKLRRALGDDSRQPVYVETVPKRGYRLIAPVVAVTRSPMPARPQRRYRRWVLATLAVLACGAGVLAWRIAPEQVALSAAGQLSTLPGEHRGGAFAPDGERVALTLDRGERTELWIVSLADDSREQLHLPRPRCDAPAWSPDGQTIASHCGGEIWLLPRAAGVARRVAAGTNPAFSPDGSRLVFERGAALLLLDLISGRERHLSGLSEPKQLFAPRSPDFSPDGRSLVFFEADEGPTGDFWTLDLDTSERRRLTRDNAIAGDPTWAPDGRDIYFSSRRDGSYALWRVNARGGVPRRVTGGGGDDRRPVLSPDGRRLLWLHSLEQFSLMLTDPATRASEPLVESRRHMLAPVVSPDGSHIAYFGEAGPGRPQLFVTTTAGEPVRQLSGEPGAARSLPQWTADGQALHFYENARNQTYRRMSVAGGPSELLIDNVSFEREHDVSVTPDGRTAIYARIDGNRVLETRMLDLASGNSRAFPVPVSWFDWASDGQRFVATEFSNASLPVGAVVLCGIDGTCRELAPRGQHPAWSSDERSVLFAVPRGASLVLYEHTLATGVTVERLTIGPVIEYGPFFDITPDGRIVWVRHAQSAAKVWMANVEVDAGGWFSSR